MRRSVSLLLLLGITALATPVLGDCDAGDEAALRWLDRMSRSLRETSYQGVFTYQHGNSVQAMRITHSVRGNIESEEVTRLSGAGSRVVRTEHPLDCIHPGHRLVRIGKLYADAENDCGIASNYRLKVAGAKRVAGRRAVVINVLPRDMYRYGYQIAVDDETGLLLKTQTIAQDGKILERFQFADVHIGEVELDGTRVDVIHQAAHAHGAVPSLAGQSDTPSWSVTWLPAGFMLTEGKDASPRDKTYTDGLAVFSVFLEPVAELQAPGDGRARQGGTTAYTRGLVISGQPAIVTVLGEVPINTARMVADNVSWSEADAN